MPQSLVKMLTHVVFSTKDRIDLIPPELEDNLFGYISGIVKNNDSKLIIANGTANHIHLLISLGKTISVSSLVGKIKRDSSTWIKTQDPKFKKFYWQNGYGAFSVSQSQAENVINYISNQKEHHKTKDFKTEYRDFLEKYEIEYDENYLWD
ncbi:MAG: IS200/IS605 family transposase [Pyrinomonadaceae bacterium]|nr:IS200/IS605 family transposase [Pyrinomonadaceae bacterium]